MQMLKNLIIVFILLHSICKLYGQTFGGVYDYFSQLPAYQMSLLYCDDFTQMRTGHFIKETYSFVSNEKPYMISYDTYKDNNLTNSFVDGEKRERQLFLFRLDCDGWKIASDKLRTDFKEARKGVNSIQYDYYFPRLDKGGYVKKTADGIFEIGLTIMYNTETNPFTERFRTEIYYLKSNGKDDNFMVFKDSPESNVNSLPQDTRKELTEGIAFKTIKIGTQIWMAENLRTTKFNDGTDIPYITDNIEWSKLTTPGYCWYNNDEASYKETSGALYNWYTVNTGKLCPSGWHVPTHEDFKVLSDYLGGDAVAGGKLKESGTVHWKGSNVGATNEIGFTALPSGLREGLTDYRNIQGREFFYSMDTDGFWWTSTESGSGARIRHIWRNLTTFAADYSVKNMGFAVRCIKN